ncbi:MAG: protein-tyrosine-phosphatase [Saprospiraceae bacterium]
MLRTRLLLIGPILFILPMLYPMSDVRAQDLLPHLATTLASLPPAQPDVDRKQALDDLAGWIRDRLQDGRPDPVEVVFICTHNSRRSQLAHAWLAALAAQAGWDRIRSFSGGTEVTAFNHRAVQALERAGFQTTIYDELQDNPRYEVKFSPKSGPMLMFSKRYDYPENPRSGFAAVMVCSDADTDCPYIPGADIRIPLPFIDPKASDGTPEEEATYDLGSRQIAAELAYVIRQIQANE